jgi:hypothetical protein
MSSSDYAGQGALPPELEERVRAELGAGERLVWVGQPRPDLYRGQTIFLTIFGIFFMTPPLLMFCGGMAVAVSILVGGAQQGNDLAAAGCVPGCFALFTLPFLLVGGTLATSLFWMPDRIRKIVYALTDRRALVWTPNFLGGGFTTRSYAGEGLGRMNRVERANGSGDLIFEEQYTSRSRSQYGFMAIDRVREVEELVRLTLLN